MATKPGDEQWFYGLKHEDVGNETELVEEEDERHSQTEFGVFRSGLENSTDSLSDSEAGWRGLRSEGGRLGREHQANDDDDQQNF